MVRTRFAPSPTGYMHIGGMRTALFNWLYARHHGGQFILRIDDTDQQRNVDAALGPILEAFRWLGLNWDEGPEVGGPYGPYFQSQRGELYRAAVAKLLESGAAYHDFESADDIKAQRDAAQAAKRTYLSSRVSLQLSPAERAAKAAAGEPHVIRLLIDRTRKVSVEDHVRGHVEWDCGLMPDPVICRNDGSPLYNFATVVDDAQLRITHVIRAEEHLTNTAVQLLIYDALSAKPPAFAHIPFVAAPGTTKKLSKREIGKYRNNPQFRKLFDIADQILPAIGQQVSDAMNPVMVAFYEEVGFLPEAVLNALSRLGWSYDDKTELMPLDFVVQHFSLDRVVKGPAGLDPDKMLACQEHWMNQVPLDQKVERCLPYLVRAKLITEPVDETTQAFVARLITALGERLKLFGDIVQYGEFFVADDALAYDEKAFNARIAKVPGVRYLLEGYCRRIEAMSSFTADDLRNQVHALAKARIPGVASRSNDFTITVIDAVARGADLLQSESYDSLEIDRQTHDFLLTEGRKLGDIVHAIRVAVTGKAAGPSLFDVMALIGRDKCVARIRRAIEHGGGAEARHSGPLTGFEPPDAILSQLPGTGESDSIQLADSEGELVSGNGDAISGTVTVYLDLRPHPQLRFEASAPLPLFAKIGDRRLRLNDPEINTDVVITHVQSHSSKAGVIEGVLEQRVTFGIPDGISRLNFHLPNFLDLRGTPIRDAQSAWAGRSRGRFKDWLITLDKQRISPDVRRKVARRRGVLITHAGSITKESTDTFSASECEEVLDLLYHAFSFARGFWVAPIMMVGEDSSEQNIWTDWSVRRTDPWYGVESWFPVHDVEALSELISCFSIFVKNGKVHEKLHAVIYWYLQANNVSRGLESALIASAIAVEAAVDFSTSFGTTACAGARSLEMLHQDLTRLLEDANVGLDVPAALDALAAFCKHRLMNGPDAISYVRDTVAHPAIQREEERLSGFAPFELMYEATNLALWYVELLVLQRLGFTRPYARRFGENRWRGQTWPLPWTQPVRSQ